MWKNKLFEIDWKMIQPSIFTLPNSHKRHTKKYIF